MLLQKSRRDATIICLKKQTIRLEIHVHKNTLTKLIVAICHICIVFVIATIVL